jgi:predicted Zn-dependent protease with MMP-like domain
VVAIAVLTLVPGCDTLGVVDLTPERFEELVGEALDSLPEELGALMENVVVLVQDRGDEPDLLGLYDGIPLTERGTSYGEVFTLPDRIWIYRLPICAMCQDEDEVVDEVAVTVIHEIAHHFGIDDDRLEELGWG